MLPPTRIKPVIALTTVSVTGAVALIWLALPWSYTASTTVRLSLTVGAVGATHLAAWWSKWVLDHQLEEGKRYLNMLTQLDEMDLLHDGVQELPVLPEDDAWNAYRMLAARLVESAQLTYGAETGKAEAELRVHKLDDQRRRATDVLAALPAPVVAINQYDEVVLTNQAARDLFELNEAPEGVAFADISPSPDLTEALNSARRRGGGSSRTCELHWTTSDEHEMRFRASCRGLAGPKQQPTGAVVILEDIADRLALQRRNAEFVSAASHEIKAPLAGIKAYVELLVDGDVPDDETRDEFVQVIDDQADRLQRLIDNLLNLARIEAGVESINKSSRPLNELLEEAARVIQPTMEKKQIQFINDLSPMYLGVMADRDMLLQSAINLLSNAAKYTCDGGTITLRSRLEDTMVSFEVADTGIGLSEDDCRRVFEKFYRAQNGEMAPGTGLGLTLAKHIVEDVHGGGLSVSSELGVGTVFRVTLPRHIQT